MNKQQAFNLVYESDLCSSARQVMTYLILRSNAEGSCFPSIRKISADTSLSCRTVQRKLRILEELQYIKCQSRTAQYGRKTSNLYTVTIIETLNDKETSESMIPYSEVSLEELLKKSSIDKNASAGESMKSSALETNGCLVIDLISELKEMELSEESATTINHNNSYNNKSSQNFEISSISSHMDKQMGYIMKTLKPRYMGFITAQLLNIILFVQCLANEKILKNILMPKLDKILIIMIIYPSKNIFDIELLEPP